MPVLRGSLEPEPQSAASLSGGRVVAFSGTARPHRFFDTLRSIGCDLVCEPLALPDHAPISEDILTGLRRKARELNAILATTSKDFARLNEEQREGVAALKVRLAWGEGSTAALDELLRPLLDEGRRSEHQ